MEAPTPRPADCGNAPPSRATVYSRTLQRACVVLGGIERLSQHLRVERADLVRWIDGRGHPPMDVFLAAVDIVLLHADRARGSA